MQSKSAEQRVAALTALAKVSDPPPQTLVVLLPTILADGPELVAALAAASNGVRVHRQYDVVVLRGIEFELTSEQQADLAKLPARLAQYSAGRRVRGGRC